MKKNYFKKLVLIVCAFAVFTSGFSTFTFTSEASSSGHGNIRFYDHKEGKPDWMQTEKPTWIDRLAQAVREWDMDYASQVNNQYAGALASSINDDGWLKGYLLGSFLSKDIEYYNEPTKVFDKVNNAYKGIVEQEPVSTTEPNCSYIYSGGDDNSTTKNFKIYQDNSSTITEDNEYNFQWYNPITQNYNYTENFYYSFDYNTYYYQQTVNNYQYDYYYIDNSTHVTNYIVETNLETKEENEYVYDMYYKLPDGRSSYDIEKDEVWGKYFIYDAQNYELVAEDDGKTLGLWHFDGDSKDSSYWSNSSGTGINLQYSDGVFGSAKYFPENESAYLTLPLDKSNFDCSQAYTIEWIEKEKKTTLVNESNRFYNQLSFYFPDYLRVENNNRFFDIYTYYAICFDGSDYQFYVNGIKKPLVDYSNNLSLSGSIGVQINSVAGFEITNNYIRIMPQKLKFAYNTTGAESYCLQHFNSLIDELRLSQGVLYSSDYVPSVEPFTTNKVLAIPDKVKKNTILFYTGYANAGYRIGGSRPTYPDDGYVYIHLENDVVDSVQQYQTNKWVEIDARVYVNNETKDLIGYDMSDFKVSRPVSPDDSGISDSGNSGDSSQTDVSGGDSGNKSDNTSDEKYGLIDGIIDFFGGIFSGLGKLVGALGNSIESLVPAIADCAGKLTGAIADVVGLIGNLIDSLFDILSKFTEFSSGFSDFLSATFTFIPAEVWSLIGLGITAMVIVGVIKIIKG